MTCMSPSSRTTQWCPLKTSLTKKTGTLDGSSQLVRASRWFGNDLTVTNPKRIAKATGKKSCNRLLLKVNQTSSVTETMQVCKLFQTNDQDVMVSHGVPSIQGD